MFSFRNGLAAIGDFNSNYGFIDRTGAMVIEARFQFTYGFTEGLAAVQMGDRWAISTPPARSSLSRSLTVPTRSPRVLQPSR